MVAAGFGVAGPSDMGVSSLMKLDVPVPVMALALVVLPPKEPLDVRLCRGLWQTVESGEEAGKAPEALATQWRKSPIHSRHPYPCEVKKCRY